MTKEAFLAVLERQRAGGLSVKRFCRNEAYSTATFYYWKNKFCSSNSNLSADSCAKNISEEFAPVCFPASQRRFASSGSEIMIELPSGIKIHFGGVAGTESAMRLITQMYSGHVLPQ
jgi:putative transposase